MAKNRRIIEEDENENELDVNQVLKLLEQEKKKRRLAEERYLALREDSSSSTSANNSISPAASVDDHVPPDNTELIQMTISSTNSSSSSFSSALPLALPDASTSTSEPAVQDETSASAGASNSSPSSIAPNTAAILSFDSSDDELSEISTIRQVVEEIVKYTYFIRIFCQEGLFPQRNALIKKHIIPRAQKRKLPAENLKLSKEMLAYLSKEISHRRSYVHAKVTKVLKALTGLPKPGSKRLFAGRVDLEEAIRERQEKASKHEWQDPQSPLFQAVVFRCHLAMQYQKAPITVPLLATYRYSVDLFFANKKPEDLMTDSARRGFFNKQVQEITEYTSHQQLSTFEFSDCANLN
eukprot:TRINITY_DN2631_c0_g1::TRINITY_DN2631_c0_g1_i1::g.25954::m.25954 TRINITY_DN2631_c0_g1::TRINITY_DN2631_c0_g1_i1::g.25954  ORF type:complete len:353 (-),score=43.56,Ashwin/PF15323.1/0.34,Ashwin/PF15323.1/3e+03 TRINITY_DN2631_c0_g1_i1:181-1239(-)